MRTQLSENISDNLSRRIKKHIHAQLHTFEVSTPPGFTDLCERWVRGIVSILDADKSKSIEIKKGTSQIRIDSAPFELCHHLLLQGLVASEIKIRIFKGRCSSVEKLSSILESINWPLWVPTPTHIALDLRVDSINSHLYNEGQLKRHVQNFFKNTSSFQQNNSSPLEIGLDFNLTRETLEIFLSLSGRRFWQRAQKQTLDHAAPLREDLAACLVARLVELNIEWGIKPLPSVVLNPFCGTGTFLHECALYLSHTGQLSSAISSWSYVHLPFFKAAAFSHNQKLMIEQAKRAAETHPTKILFVGEDTDERLTTATAAWFNATRLPFENDFQVIARPANSLLSNENDDRLEKNQLGWIFANPPFGIRLANTEKGGTEQLYMNFAKRLRALEKSAQGHSAQWSGVLLCPTEESWSIVCKSLRGWQQKSEHFTLGGLDIRALYFASPLRLSGSQLG